MLARQGWRVVLLERERFPRESMSASRCYRPRCPSSRNWAPWRLCRRRGSLPKYGATMVWGRDPGAVELAFPGDQRPVSPCLPGLASHLRPHTAAKRPNSCGVDVREGCRRHRAWTCGRHGIPMPPFGTVSDTAGQCGLTVTARFVVDASGQAAHAGPAERQRGSWDSVLPKPGRLRLLSKALSHCLSLG